ncbi:MAG: immunoglobulin domain-containing protein, partial [bacterium]
MKNRLEQQVMRARYSRFLGLGVVGVVFYLSLLLPQSAMAAPGLPAITTQPISAVATVGQLASLSVANSGTGPFNYQWYKDGVRQIGQTNTTLSYTSFAFTASGSYYAVVTSMYGMAISFPATLSVTNAPLQVWGRNDYGQLGNGTTNSVNVPAQVASNVVLTASGQYHSLFVKADSTLWTMGWNPYGALGDGTFSNTNRPIQVASNVVAAAGGYRHSLFVKADGTLWAMGDNTSGQLGAGTATATNQPIMVTNGVVMVAAGDSHSLFVKKDGTLWTMGYNYSGELGNGTTINTNRPIMVASNVVAVAGGNYHSLFVKADGTLWAMGFNTYGQLGNGTVANALSPIQVASNVVGVAGGQYHSLFVKADGMLWGMGRDDNGQLGNGAMLTTTNLPVQVTNSVVAVACGASHSLLAKADGTLWTMGLNAYGQLGNGTLSTSYSPVQVAGGGLLLASLTKGPSYDHSLAIAEVVPPAPPAITAQPISAVVTVGQPTSLSVTNSGTGPFGYQWFKDGVRQTGQTNSTLSYASFAFTNSGSYSVVITNALGMAISLPANLSVTNATLRVWGYNSDGQLGNGTTTHTNLPITVASNVVVAAGGFYHSLFVKADNTLWAMGKNNYGQLGNGTTGGITNIPVQVASNVVTVAAGEYHSLFVKANGTLWTMGRNYYGQLGNNTYNDANQPVQVANNVVAVAGGGEHSLFVKANGTLWTMGYNLAGQLGDGTTAIKISPVLVTSNVVAVGGGTSHSLFMKADGTLWAMGYNYSGQLGDGTTINRSSPVQVASNVMAMASGTDHSLFVKEDGTLWGMGYNAYGQLCNEPSGQISRPVQAASNVVAVAAGFCHSMFVKEDGTLWGMGANSGGLLGNGTTDNAYQPVQVFGLLAASLAKKAGSIHSLAIAEVMPPAPPAITAQPISAVVAVGQAASLSVTNSGTGPFGYQWLKDGVILAGQTNSTLSYTSFQFTDSSSYSVVITNAYGMAISFPASLSIPNAPLRVWGNNVYGQLGNGTNGTGVYALLPITVASNVVATAGGAFHSLFVKADNTLWAMGYNFSGQLGNGTTTDTNRPIAVASNVVATAAGAFHSLFVKADGTLWSMGRNVDGQLGDGTNTNIDRPVQVASNVVAAAGGEFHSLFVKADGTLWAMGANVYGQLGNNTTNNANLPIMVASNVMAVAAGGDQSLFVKADNTLWAMGENSSGQLGNGTTVNESRPIQVTNNVTAVAVGGAHSLFVKADGMLWTMGNNNFGQMGNSITGGSTNQPIQVASNVVMAATGYNHSLFVKADGALWAMGNNTYGQLGNGKTVSTNCPTQVSGGLLTVVLAQAPLAEHSLAIAGAVPVVSVSNQTVTVDQTTNFVAVVTGDGPFTYQWQKNGTNIVNATNASYTVSSAAVSDAGNYAVSVVSPFGTTTSAVATLTVNKATPSVTTWPTASTITFGQTLAASTLSGGTGSVAGVFAFTLPATVPAVGSTSHGVTFTPTDTNSYNSVTSSVSVTAIDPPAISSQPVSAVLTAGQAANLSATHSGTGPFGYQWLKDGVILAGQTNRTLSYTSFAFTNSGSYSVVITNAYGMTISFPASLSVPDAPLQVWGNNVSGQRGDGTNTDTNRPVYVTNNVVVATGGFSHSLFVKADGTLWAMGYNAQGQLGNGTTANTNLPVYVTNNVVAAAGGSGYSLFVKADGTLWAMGQNNYGQLGDGTTANTGTNLPVQVANNVVAAAGGSGHSLFVKADGTLWAMGQNNYGQLGDGTTANTGTNLPVQVANNVVAAACGSGHSLFVKADGTLWAMGWNAAGQMGDGTTNNASLPVQVANNVVVATGGRLHSLFVKADGTLWAMGNNVWGQLGNGTNTETNRPVYVTNNVAAAAGGYQHSLFVKADGTLWTMGYNNKGQLGNGTTDSTNLPVQVTGLLVASLAKEPQASHSLAIAEILLPDLQVLGTNGTEIESGSGVSPLNGTQFAPILPGATVTNTLSITNNGMSLLTISGAGVQGAGFRVQGIPATVSVGAVSSFDVVFNPDAVGSFTSTLSISNNSPTAVYTVNLAGSCYQLSANSGPYVGGNTITVTNGTFGTITHVLVGGVQATITGSGTTWFTITLPAAGSAGVKDIVVQTSNNGDITLTGAYTVNPAGVIGLPAGPSVWTNLSSGVDVAVQALAPDANGDLYVGGLFANAGGKAASRIAKWNASSGTWTNLGSGVNGVVRVLAYDGANLYVGGEFTTAGGVTANRVAKWTASSGTWTNLGSGMNDTVFTLAHDGTNLYAGGYFTTADGVTVNKVAKWNGTSWTNLGSGVNTYVYALAHDGTNLYAGGYFTTAGGVSANNVAMWNGTSWTNLAGGVNGNAYALTHDGTNLYAGGSFTTAGGLGATRMAKWNGTSWTNMGSGTSGDVMALSHDGANLYAGGSFTTAGGVTVNRVAKWDTLSGIWTNMGAGMDISVYALAQNGANLYAGGGFTTAGGVAANRVAKWGPTFPADLGVTPSSGSWVGGYSVVISGTNLCDGTMGDVTNVTLCGVSATVTAVNGSTQIVVTAGVSGVTGLGDVRVFSTSFGTTIKSNAFEYLRVEQVSLVFTPASPQTFGTTNALSVSGGSGTGAVSYDVLSGPGQIVGGTSLVMTGGVGTVQVRALKAQDNLYFVTSITSGVTAAKASQSISFANPGAQLTTNSVGLAATASSGLVPTFSVVSGAASISEGTNLIFTTAGNVSVVAAQGGDGNWNSATSVTNTFTVSLTEQATMTFSSLVSPQIYATTNTISAIGGSGTGLVSYAVQSGPGTILGTGPTFRFIVLGMSGVKLVVNSGTGTVVVVATRAASALYSAQSITGLVNCAKAEQGITFTGFSDQFWTNQLLLAATASSSLGVAFTVASGPALISNNTNLSFTGYGTVGIAAAQTGNENYKAASSVTNFIPVLGPQLAVLGTNSAVVANSNVVSIADGTDFGACVIGKSTVTNQFVVRNIGNAPAGISGVTMTGLGANSFELVSPPPFATTIDGDDVSFKLAFQPRAGGLQTAVFTIYYNGTNTAYRVNVVGVGLDGGIALTTNTLLYGATYAGTNPVAQSVDLTNVGGSGFTYTNVIAYGSGALAWLSARPAAGTVEASASTNLAFTANITNLNAGTYTATNFVTAADATNSPQSVVVTLTVAKAAQTVNFANIGDQLTTNIVTLSAAATSGLNVTNFSVVSGSALISEGTNLTFTGAGSVSVVAEQAGDGNWNPAVSETNTFTVSLAEQAVLTFNPASPQIYATTNTITATGGSGVGMVSYVVYSGPGTIFGNDTFRSSGFTGSYRPPAGANLIVNSGTGTVVVVATKAASALYNVQSVTGVVECAKAPASVGLSNTNQVYSGEARVATATTVPAGQTVDLTYDGSINAPTNVGAYTVIGIVNEVNYQGGTTGTLTVTRGSQTVNFSDIGDQLTTNIVTLSATATSGLSVTNFSVVSGPAVISAGIVSFTNAGPVVLSAIQEGDANWIASPATNIAFNVTKALASVELSNTNQIYNGTARAVTATTIPAGQTVDLTYDGS